MFENYVRDNFEVVFTSKEKENSIENMLEFFKKRHWNSEWLGAKVDDISLKIIPNGPLFVDEILNDYRLIVSEQAVEDTQEDSEGNGNGASQFVIKLNDKYYLLSNTALDGIVNNFIGYGVASNFKKLKKIQQKEALEIFKNANPNKELKLFYSAEKIRAIQSRKYEPMAQYDLINKLLEELKTKGKIELVYGKYTHNNTILCFKILNQELIKEYVEAYNVHSLYRAKEIIPYINFNTSDVGSAAAKVIAGFIIDGDIITLGDIISVEHISGNTIENFYQELPNLFVLYKAEMEKLISLFDIEIKHPIFAAKTYLEEVGFSDNIIKENLKSFISNDEEHKYNAHDLFVFANILIDHLNADGKISDTATIKIKENISRSINKKGWDYLDKGAE